MGYLEALLMNLKTMNASLGLNNACLTLIIVLKFVLTQVVYVLD